MHKAFNCEVPKEALQAAADELVEAAKDKTVMVVAIAGGYQMRSNPVYADYARRLLGERKENTLSAAAMEALAIIAYKQPITQADIESLRGKNSTGVLATLMEKNLIKIMGRAKDPGHAYLYGTTKEFLKLFGINALTDMPKIIDAKEYEESGMESARH